MSDDVSSFLIQSKSLILKNHRRFIPRDGYLQDLLDLGFPTIERAWKELLHLEPTDLIKPPEADRDGSGKQVWIFKREYNGIMAYIKLSIDERGCVCISFHPDRP